ncbi:MAG: uroporphyrinogen decarboxylase family protein [Armatimonadota bacterium]
MTLRENVLSALRGQETEQIPFTCYAGLAPEGAEEIENLCFIATARVAVESTPGVSTASEEIRPGVYLDRMETPWGTLTREREAEPGYGSSYTTRHWIGHPDEYAILEQVIRNSVVETVPDAYADARAQWGDRGVVLVWTPRTPFQRLWIEYTGIERLSYDLADCPDVVEGVMDAMFEQSRQVARLNAQSGAELVWLPDNITGEIAGTSVFERYLIPYYREMRQIIEAEGKLACCHMDGFLRQIKGSIADTALPVIEAFTPPPDGNLSVAEALAAWPEKALSLNFPSSVHMSSPEEIKRVTRELVAQAAGRRGFVMGVTENIPASVGVRSLEAIGEALREG